MVFFRDLASLGHENGFVSLSGLLWLKLLSGRALDEADIIELAKRRTKNVAAARKQLPSTLHERFDALISRAKREIETDPNNGPAEDD